MGECINLRRGGEKKTLPVLNPNYPADLSIMRSNGEWVNFEVVIDTHGNPAEYTYKWYLNGEVNTGATGAVCSFGRNSPAGTYTLYCEVTNKAGTVRSRTATFTVRPAYLYHYGDQYVENSGGWKLSRALPDGQSHGLMGSLTFNTDNMYVELPKVSGKPTEGHLVAQNKIDLTGYSKIRFLIYPYTPNADYAWTLGVTTADSIASACWVAAVHASHAGNQQWQTIDLDISGLSGSYYVSIWNWTYSHSAYAHIASVELIL